MIRKVTVIASISLAACVASDEPTASEDTNALTCTINNSSLIETDTQIVNDTNFGLHKVFDRIRLTTPTTATHPVSFPSTALPMFQEIYAAFDDCTSTTTIDPNGYGLPCRAPEASLATLNPFSSAGSNPLHYRPVALTNRIDLAPTDGSYCGEARIVYWKDSGVVGRSAIIVELKMPSAILAGVHTCQPVIDFWAHLSSVTDVATRTTLLTDFYFKGIAGTPTAPVTLPAPPVSATGAGFNGAGQVRLNSFLSSAQWNLREFKWKKVCSTQSGTTSCSAHFVEQAVANNPSQLLFAGTHPNAPAFQSWFVSTATPQLASASKVTELELANANAYNAFESVSEPEPGDPTSVLYSAAASATLRAEIGSKLASIGSTLTVDEVLARATTQTCAGCHQLSNGASLGGGLTWPVSNIFTMIDENGKLAPALTKVFLPFRRQALQALACPGAAGTAPQGI
jgi:hypothetical protein